MFKLDGCGNIDYKRIIRASIAFLVFLCIVLIINFIADIFGEKSPTGPIKIIGWLCGSLIAFEIFEKMAGKEKEE